MTDLSWGVLAGGGVGVVLVTGAVVVALVVKVVRKHRQVHQPGMPTSARVAYYGSIVYTIFPVDLLPDPILLDDIGVLVAALMHVGHVAKKISAAGEPKATHPPRT